MNPTATVSTEEQQQILQTIEMFEVITHANPSDCQSLEVLKEAYWKLGRQEDATKIARQLADAYAALGQYASAMLECEDILSKQPDHAEAKALLEELESKLNQPDPAAASQRDKKDARDGKNASLVSDSDATLIRTTATVRPEGEADHALNLDNDGNDPLGKFLTQHRLVAADSLTGALSRVRQKNDAIKSTGEAAITHSLIGELCETNAADLDALLCGILDRTKLAYVPLECYDVDRQIVKMLPESLTLGRLIVPFDLISRTVMIAMANPFDALGKEAVQQLFDYNIQWHVASPAAITQTLKDVYRLDRGAKK